MPANRAAIQMDRRKHSNDRYSKQAVLSKQQQASRHTILVTEDDLGLLALKLEVLQGEGYTVHGFATAEESLEFFQHNQSIDLLVADVHLCCAQTGIDLAERMVEIRPPLPILLMSGGILDEGQVWKIHSHSWTFVRKPLTVATLLSIVESLLHSTRHAAEPFSPRQQSAINSIHRE